MARAKKASCSRSIDCTKHTSCSSSDGILAKHDLGWPPRGLSGTRKKTNLKSKSCSLNAAEKVVCENTDLVGIITSDTTSQTSYRQPSSDKRSSVNGRDGC